MCFDRTRLNQDFSTQRLLQLYVTRLQSDGPRSYTGYMIPVFNTKSDAVQRKVLFTKLKEIVLNNAILFRELTAERL